MDDDRPVLDLTADKLGIDSLVAVDIRSWFIKELQVEIPVLKILSGATIGEILTNAQELLPQDLTPNLDPNSTAKPRPKQNQSPKKPNETQKKPIQGQQKEATAKKPQKNLQTIPSASPKANNPLAIPSDKKKDEPKVSVKVEARSQETSSSDIEADTAITSSTNSTSVSSSWIEVEKFDTRTVGPSDKASAITSEFQAPLDTVKVERKLPIGLAQSRFWFLKHYVRDPSTFNITASVSLDGPLDFGRFQHAVKVVGQRHEALRTRFVVEENGDISQEVLATSTLVLETRDVSHAAEVDEAYHELKRYNFGLGEGEIIRVILLKKSSTSSQLIIAYHHINMDGVSLEVILQDLQAAYNSKFLSPRVLQYPDFSERQRTEYQSGRWADDLAFWRREFPRVPSALPLLPMAKVSTRSTLTTYATNTADFRIDSTVLQSIQNTCRKLKVTPFHFHLAVFYTLLIRLVDVEEVCIGTGSANRSGAGMNQSVGLYLNLLPLLFQAKHDQTFTNVLKIVREKSLAAFSHSKVAFDVLLNELGVPRSATHSPLFQVLVNYRAGISQSRRFCDCESKITEFEQGRAPYDLSLDVIDSPDGDCRVILAGQSVLYSDYDMGILKSAYSSLLVSFARNPALRLSIPSLYDVEEVKKAIQLGQGPAYKYHWPETIPHRIDMMVSQFGNKVALTVGQGKTLTYTQMAQRVNSIALALRDQQVEHGSVVGVFLEPGVDWICSLLAIFRLDATYVPLDRRVGLERLSTIVQDCKPKTILIDTNTDQDSRTLTRTSHIINVDHIAETDETSCVPNAATSDSVAAIMYTSGSTGGPKGIVMKHQSFRNNVESSTAKWYFREGREITNHQGSPRRKSVERVAGLYIGRPRRNADRRRSL